MSEFEDKINKLLSSPEDMEKIMGLAKTLTGSQGSPDGEKVSGGSPGLDSLSSLLTNVDPKIFSVLTRVLGEYSSKSNDKAALIAAIKPYLKEDRREKIDKAAQIAQIAHLAKAAFSEFSGGSDV